MGKSFSGIRVVGKDNWKERAVGKNVQLESFKLESLKLESFAEVGKFRCSWKVLAEVGKFNELGKLSRTLLLR